MQYSSEELAVMRSGLGAQYAYLPFWTGFSYKTPLGDAKYEWSHWSRVMRCHAIGGTSPVDFIVSSASKDLTGDTKIQKGVNGSKYTTMEGTQIAHCLNEINQRMHKIKFHSLGSHPTELGVDFDNYILMQTGFPYLSIPDSGFVNVKTFLKAINEDYDKLISSPYLPDDSSGKVQGHLFMMQRVKLYNRMNSFKLLTHQKVITNFVEQNYNINSTHFNELWADHKRDIFDFNVSYNHLLKHDKTEYDNYKDILKSCKRLSDAMSKETKVAGISTSYKNDSSKPIGSFYQQEEVKKYLQLSSENREVSKVLRKYMGHNMSMSFREELTFFPCYAHLLGSGSRSKIGEPMESLFNYDGNSTTLLSNEIVPFNLAHSNIMRMLDQHGCVLQGSQIMDNEDKVLHECFHVLHKDDENYICSATGLNAPVMSEYELDIFDDLNYPNGRDSLRINPISQSTSFETQGILYVVPKYMLTNSDTDLKFGDHILITGKDQRSLYYTEKGDRLISPMRAVHGKNGVYDIVINANSFSKQKIQLTGIKNQNAGYMPMRQFIALAIGANRVASTYTISGTYEPLQNPDKPKWIDTWRDNRGYFTLELNQGESIDRSDLINCQECNARVIVYLAQHTNDISGRCPNCDDENGIQFPHLKKKNKGEK